MESYILLHKNERELDSLAPNPCMHSLLTNNHHGLAGKIYEALITKYTKNHFSAHIKWNKAGHLYSKVDIINAANTICKLKVSALIKDTLLKHQNQTTCKTRISKLLQMPHM